MQGRHAGAVLRHRRGAVPAAPQLAVEGAGALGFFPPTSIVPFWTTVAIAVMFLGVVFGWWLTLIGAGIGLWAAFGWAYEYYVGDYKH